MSIDNGVIVLADNVPATMRFKAMIMVTDQRRDPQSGFVSDVNRLTAQVFELNGRPVLTIFDTLAEKLHAQLLPYKDDPSLSAKLFTITKTGRGYLTEYTVQVS